MEMRQQAQKGGTHAVLLDRIGRTSRDAAPTNGHHPWRFSPDGFSLPEVAVAVAIAALAIVTILGVLPMGLDTIRAAGVKTASSRIQTQIAADLQLMDWGKADTTAAGWTRLAAALEDLWYFDDQANPIEPTASGFDMRISYVARVRLSGQPASVPGEAPPASGSASSGNSQTRPDMKIVLVDIAATPNPDFDFSNPGTFETSPLIFTRQIATGK